MGMRQLMRSRTFWAVVCCYAVALIQVPGQTVADTKVHLYVEPARFLSDVLSLWSPSPGLGHVWASQYGGYAWPMAPWFAAGDWLGMPAWLVHRLWLGSLFAVAATGVMRLLGALIGTSRPNVHLLAAVVYTLNPFVVVYSSRASITLAAYAALPWLILFAHRGLRSPHGWRWPALFALVVASSGGGINAATIAFAVIGPVLLVAYERWALGTGRGAIWPLAWRTAVCGTIVNLWWLVPLLIAGRSAPNFLAFTEQPGTIWSTTSLSETLRLMGFWTSYVGTGFTDPLVPYQSTAPALLFLLPVVLASLAIPAVALGSFAWTGRTAYLPFFAAMLLVGIIVMSAGWPEGTPLREALTGVYYRVNALQPLRTTYKAGGLVALPLAVLFAYGAAHAARGLPRRAVGFAAGALIVLAGWPLVTGRALERQLHFDVPGAVRALAADIDRRPHDRRALLVPGQHFASHKWGGTVDAVLPALTRHPVATRWIIPFADLRSAELQMAIDAQITQGRLVPGQLRPLLDLLAVGDLLLAADGDRRGSGQMPAADTERTLRAAGGLQGRRTTYGQRVVASAAVDGLQRDLLLPRITRYEVPTAGMLRVVPQARPVLIDGSASAIIGLAAFGALDTERVLRYSPDMSPAELRETAAGPSGATVVVGDGTRRRAFVAARPRGTDGPTLAAGESVSADGTILDPFGGTTTDAETVSVLRGLRSVSAPASPQVTQFPDRRPFAALDGDEATAWIADRFLASDRSVLTIEMESPIDLPVLRVLPYSDSRGVVTALKVNGRRFAVERGWNTLPVGLRGVSRLEVQIASVTRPARASGGAGGIREIELPGVEASEWLRPPVVAERALRGADLRRTELIYLFERTSADVPFRQRRYVGERGAGLLRDAQDAEPQLRRTITPPARGTFTVDAWATPSLRADDSAFDQILNTEPAGYAVDSSSRFDGAPRHRGSQAFDGDPDTAWIGQWIPGRPAWLSWRTRKVTTIKRLTLVPSGAGVRMPRTVRLSAGGRSTTGLAVTASGQVRLPRPVRGREFRLEIVRATFAPNTPLRLKQRRAVGVAELRVPGLPVRGRSRAGRVLLSCGVASVRVADTPVPLRGQASAVAIERGAPVRLRGCSEAMVASKPTDVFDPGRSTLRVDRLRLTRPAEQSPKAERLIAGRVRASGPSIRGRRAETQLEIAAPSWVVFGQSYAPGWQATCNGRNLGTPQPVNGYANGWRVGADCRELALAYGPQRLASAAGWVSLAGALILVLVLAAGMRRPAGVVRLSRRLVPLAGVGDREESRTVRSALALGVGAGAGIGLMFGLRAGVVAAPLVTLLLLRPPRARSIGYGVALLLGIIVPGIYSAVALFADDQRIGGNSTQYPSDRMFAHWVALAALVLFAVLVVRAIADTRRDAGDVARAASQ